MQSVIYGVQCNGQESELLNCSKSEVMEDSCESVAGIVCQGIHNSQHMHRLPLLNCHGYDVFFFCTCPSTYK